MAAYVNPLKSIRNLQMGRTDQGVDATGTGPVLAMGAGTVLSTHNSGWPGGGFVVIHLDNPIGGHAYYYTAEDITPTVSVGQKVKAGQQIGTAFAGATGLELGWAGSGSALGESLYRAQNAGAAYSEGTQTPQGQNFRSVLDALMAGKQPAGGTSSSSGGTSGSSAGDQGASGVQTTAATSANPAAAGGGCLITMLVLPVLIPAELIRSAAGSWQRTHADDGPADEPDEEFRTYAATDRG
jgi:hypothetical protein